MEIGGGAKRVSVAGLSGLSKLHNARVRFLHPTRGSSRRKVVAQVVNLLCRGLAICKRSFERRQAIRKHYKWYRSKWDGEDAWR